MPRPSKIAEEEKKAAWAATHLKASMQPEPKPKHIDTGLFLTIIGLAGTGIIALLQWNGVVTVRWAWSAVGYALLVVLSLWAFWNWEVIHRSRQAARIASSVLFGSLLVAIPSIGVVSQYRREHEQPPQSVITMNVLSTHMAYPKGRMLAGIEWREGYGELRVTIKNGGNSTIQNVDLTIQVFDNANIWDIGQLSDIPGVEFHPLDNLPDFNIRINGVDGGYINSPFRDMFNGKGISLSDRWKIFCQRLTDKAELRLVLATLADKTGSAVSTKIRLSGNYELMPREGSKNVMVDLIVPVTQ